MPEAEDTANLAKLLNIKLLPSRKSLESARKKIEACLENPDFEDSEEEFDDEVKDRSYDPKSDEVDTGSAQHESDEDSGDNLNESSLDGINSDIDESSVENSDKSREESIMLTRATQRRLEKEGKAFDKAIVDLSKPSDQKNFGESLKKPHLKKIDVSKREIAKGYACYFCLEKESKKDPKDRKIPKLHSGKIIHIYCACIQKLKKSSVFVHYRHQ